jgi:hypothetical protein
MTRKGVAGKSVGSGGSGPIKPFIELANVVLEVPSLRFPNLLDPEIAGPGIDRGAVKPLQNTPPHVPEKGESPFGPGVTLNNYTFDEAVANTLRQIASLNGSGQIELNSAFVFQQRNYIQIDRKGEITFAETVFSESYRLFRAALELTDARLIRVCPRCQKLFLATRRGKKFCSSNCRQREWCIENPEKWSKIQRVHESTRGYKEAKERKRHQLGLKFK